MYVVLEARYDKIFLKKMPVTNSYFWILNKMENYSHRSIDVFMNAYMFCVCVSV